MININCGDINGRTALHWAAYFGCLAMVEALLKHPNIDPTLKAAVRSVLTMSLI
jgi:ankyrin repeat protein